MPVSSENAIATPSTCQFNSACNVKFVCPLPNSRVRKRIPQIANKTPRSRREKPTEHSRSAIAVPRETAPRPRSAAARSRDASRPPAPAANSRRLRTRSPGSIPPSPSAHRAASNISGEDFQPGRPGLHSTPEDSRAPDQCGPWSPPIGETSDRAPPALAKAHAGSQTPHHLNPIIILIEVIRALGAKLIGTPQICPRASEDTLPEPHRIDAEEPWRRHSRHDEGKIVDQNRLPCGVRGSAETPLAVPKLTTAIEGAPTDRRPE